MRNIYNLIFNYTEICEYKYVKYKEFSNLLKLCFNMNMKNANNQHYVVMTYPSLSSHLDDLKANIEQSKVMLLYYLNQ